MTFWVGKTGLIAGGAGMIGPHLARALLERGLRSASLITCQAVIFGILKIFAMTCPWKSLISGIGTPA